MAGVWEEVAAARRRRRMTGGDAGTSRPESDRETRAQQRERRARERLLGSERQINGELERDRRLGRER
ncbi:hypothetical protein SLA2020_437750 [Shorea laevis]